jgi:hypothetical protein
LRAFSSTDTFMVTGSRQLRFRTHPLVFANDPPVQADIAASHKSAWSLLQVCCRADVLMRLF